MDIKMLEITSKNCCKYNLETVNTFRLIYGILKLKQKENGLISFINMVIVQL